MDTGRSCWLCGRNGSRDPLDKHHIFGGARRNLSERYGLTVYLCHSRCHENGPTAAHRCRETADALHAYGQRTIMAEQGWSVEEFMYVFGKNYIDEEDEETPHQSAGTAEGEAKKDGGFRLLDWELPEIYGCA